jgi:hypothetical protein
VLASLTPEQLAVVTAPIDSRQLVNAGPGTGKTHTLTARISHLIEEQDLAPGAVLALSFSRAAVGVLRSRLRSSEDASARVLPVTFDSMATRILADLEPDGAWTEQSYDGRIEAATARIADVVEFLGDIQHVCIDEVQDLVGVRMQFVCALLQHLDLGFSLLGDLAQGIYDFTLDDEVAIEMYGAPAFYSWVRSTFADVLAEHTLTVNHRSRTENARAASLLGASVVADVEAAGRQLAALLEAAPSVPMSMLTRGPADATTAILCRTNGVAMLVSRTLSEEGIEHVLQRRATDRLIAPWVADLLSAVGGGTISRERFERISAEWSNPPDVATVWGPMRRIARGTGPTVDLDLFLKRLRTGVVPDELQTNRTTRLTVSTVHRAKGLEFDRVAVVNAGWERPLDDAATKTLFVALTRPRDAVLSVEPPKYHEGLKKLGNRWSHRGWQKSHRHGFEVSFDDIDLLSPAGGPELGIGHGDLQSYLRTKVHPGDPVTIRFVRMRIGSPPTALMHLVHNETPVAVMSDQFAAALGYDLKSASRNWNWPPTITGISIDAVRTVVGDPLITNQVGLGPSGAWLAPATAGLGKFEWKDSA